MRREYPNIKPMVIQGERCGSWDVVSLFSKSGTQIAWLLTCFET